MLISKNVNYNFATDSRVYPRDFEKDCTYVSDEMIIDHEGGFWVCLYKNPLGSFNTYFRQIGLYFSDLRAVNANFAVGLSDFDLNRLEVINPEFPSTDVEADKVCLELIASLEADGFTQLYSKQAKNWISDPNTFAAYYFVRNSGELNEEMKIVVALNLGNEQ